MRGERIDFISSYCDRWCERCAFTDRCSTYAVHIATAMCDGDFAAGLELPVGAPPAEDVAEQARRDAFLKCGANDEPTEQELAAIKRETEEHEERLDESPITTLAIITMLLTRRWLEQHRDRMLHHADPRVVDAIEVIGWDCYLIGAKVRRALSGRDLSERGEDPFDDPIQNDWNGSAKVALISIERSTIAWDTLAQATSDPDARTVAGQLRTLRIHVQREFPDAWKFIRPGFDGGA